MKKRYDYDDNFYMMLVEHLSKYNNIFIKVKRPQISKYKLKVGMPIVDFLNLMDLKFSSNISSHTLQLYHSDWTHFIMVKPTKSNKEDDSTYLCEYGGPHRIYEKTTELGENETYTKILDDYTFTNWAVRGKDA